MLLRLRRISLGVLGLVGAFALALIVFISQLGWPGVLSGPLPSEPQRVGTVHDAVALTTSPRVAPAFPPAGAGGVGTARPAPPATAPAGRTHSATGNAGIRGPRKLSTGHSVASQPAGAQPAQPVAPAPAAPSQPAPVTTTAPPSPAPIVAAAPPAEGKSGNEKQGKEGGRKAGTPSTAEEGDLDGSEDVEGSRSHGGKSTKGKGDAPPKSKSGSSAAEGKQGTAPAPEAKTPTPAATPPEKVPPAWGKEKEGAVPGKSGKPHQ